MNFIDNKSPKKDKKIFIGFLRGKRYFFLINQILNKYPDPSDLKEELMRQGGEKGIKLASKINEYWSIEEYTKFLKANVYLKMSSREKKILLCAAGIILLIIAGSYYFYFSNIFNEMVPHQKIIDKLASIRDQNIAEYKKNEDTRAEIYKQFLSTPSKKEKNLLAMRYDTLGLFSDTKLDKAGEANDLIDYHRKTYTNPLIKKRNLGIGSVATAIAATAGLSGKMMDTKNEQAENEKQQPPKTATYEYVCEAFVNFNDPENLQYKSVFQNIIKKINYTLPLLKKELIDDLTSIDIKRNIKKDIIFLERLKMKIEKYLSYDFSNYELYVIYKNDPEIRDIMRRLRKMLQTYSL